MPPIDDETQDIEELLKRETADGPGNLDDLPEGDFEGEDTDG